MSRKRKWILLKMLRPFAGVWMKFDTKTKKTSDVDYKREEPFVLLGNHVYMFDVVSLAMPWKNTPAIVASEFLMSQKGLKFLLNNVARIIPKSKGAADVRTAKGLIRFVKDGFPVMIMPEGDTTFSGETNYVEEATAKLIKKLKIDVVVGKFQGGYLSKPRWATGKRRNRHVELHYKIVIKKEDIPNMTEDEIYSVIKEELYNNDFEWQRERMHPYGGSKLAEGLENMIYKCPDCGALNSFTTEGNKFKCKVCEIPGHVDKYGFLQGYKFDNLVEWDRYQKEYLEELRGSIFNSPATIVEVDLENNTRTTPVEVSVAYAEGSIFVKGKEVTEFKVEKIFNPVITMRNNFSFDYEGTLYRIKIERHVLAFSRVCQDKY